MASWNFLIPSWKVLEQSIEECVLCTAACCSSGGKLYSIGDMISATVWPAESRKRGRKIQYENDNNRALDPSLLEGLKREEEEGEEREIINNTA